MTLEATLASGTQRMSFLDLAGEALNFRWNRADDVRVLVLMTSNHDIRAAVARWPAGPRNQQDERPSDGAAIYSFSLSYVGGHWVPRGFFRAHTFAKDERWEGTPCADVKKAASAAREWVSSHSLKRAAVANTSKRQQAKS